MEGIRDIQEAGREERIREQSRKKSEEVMTIWDADWGMKIEANQVTKISEDKSTNKGDCSSQHIRARLQPKIDP